MEENWRKSIKLFSKYSYIIQICSLEQKMTKEFLADVSISELKKLYPSAVCSLTYGSDPWRLLVMARLSAQCTDARVNIVCENLFKKYPDVYLMSEANVTDIENEIRPCGLYRMKAKDIVAMSQTLVNDFDGKVPDEMDKLLLLSGVGRKIANLILGDVFGKPAIVTDTHCIRICGRLGFYPETLKDPRKIEKILSDIIPKSEGSDFCHRIVNFGRDICTARAPKCDDCPLAKVCNHNKR